MKIKKYQNAGVLPRLKNFGRRVFNTMNSVSQQASENMRDVHTGTLHSDIKNLQDKGQYEKAKDLAKGYLKANAAGIAAGVGAGVAGVSNVLNPSTYLAKLPAAIAGTENATAIASAAAPVIDAYVAGGYAAGSATKAAKNLKEKNYKQFAINAGLTALSAIPAVKGFRSVANNTNHSVDLMRHLYNSARYNPKWISRASTPIKENIINYNDKANRLRRTTEIMGGSTHLNQEAAKSIADGVWKGYFDNIREIPISKMNFTEGLKHKGISSAYYNPDGNFIRINMLKDWNKTDLKSVLAHELQHGAQGRFVAEDKLGHLGQKYYKPNPSNSKIYRLFHENVKVPREGSWYTSPDEWNSEYAYIMQKTNNWVPYNTLSASQKKPVLNYFTNRFLTDSDTAHTILDTMGRLGYKNGGKLNDSI